MIKLRDFTGGPVIKNLPTNAGDRCEIPGPETNMARAKAVCYNSACTIEPK